MISIIVISIVFLAALILATVAVLRRLDSPNRSLPVTAEWIDELSTGRYRPMMRLLDSRSVGSRPVLVSFCASGPAGADEVGAVRLLVAGVRCAAIGCAA